jgi:hypothetical protein
MCDLFSWIESDGKVVFATDDVIEAAYHDRPVAWDDAVGHTFLVNNLNAYGKHCEGIWKVPPEIAKAVNSGLCRKMMKSQGWVGLKYTKDGKAKFDKVTSAGNIDLRQGATLTAPVLAQSGNIDLRQGATLTAPMLNMAKK